MEDRFYEYLFIILKKFYKCVKNEVENLYTAFCKYCQHTTEINKSWVLKFKKDNNLKIIELILVDHLQRTDLFSSGILPFFLFLTSAWVTMGGTL